MGSELQLPKVANSAMQMNLRMRTPKNQTTPQPPQKNKKNKNPCETSAEKNIN